MARWRSAVVLVALAAAPIVLVAQQARFSSSVNLVRVDVLATDRGRPIQGLTAADFELRDEGVVQQIDAVAAESEALDVFFVFDTSASVEGAPLFQLREAAIAVLDALHADDRAELVTFSHRIVKGKDLTGDIATVRQAVARITGRGATSLVDALYLALVHQPAGRACRMVLVFSDGHDNRSWLTPAQVRQVARETEAVIYAVAFKPAWVIGTDGRWSKSSDDPDEALLGDVSKATGGQLVIEQDSGRFKELFLRLLGEMRSRYLVTYYPRGVPQAGWHSIDVRLKNRPGRVSARGGYRVAK